MKATANWLNPWSAICLPLLSLIIWCGGCSSDERFQCVSNVDIYTKDDSRLLRGIHCIEGDLTITTAALSRLDDLAALQYVGGSVRIEGNKELEDLSGLSGLAYVGGYFGISDNPRLSDASGLVTLAEIGRGLRISDNPVLPMLSGWPSLVSVGDYVYIFNNENLGTIDAFARLETVGQDAEDIPSFVYMIYDNPSLFEVTLPPEVEARGHLYIRDNASLSTIQGCSSCSIDGSLAILDNNSLVRIIGFERVVELNTVAISAPMLTQLSGFSELLRLRARDSSFGVFGGNLLLQETESLQEIEAFGSLTTVDGTISIVDNQSVMDMSWLLSLERADALRIYGNKAMDLESLNQWLQQVSVDGESKVVNNGPDGQPVPGTCPWAGDGVCDEAASQTGTPGTNVCESDPEDCA